MTELQQQIEAAFDYRGHVSVILASGKTVAGFLYNRHFENGPGTDAGFVELFLAGSGEPCQLDITTITTVELTGKDEAAGKSYHDWLQKKSTSKTDE